MSRLKDLTGQKFGRLYVIKLSSKDNRGKAVWECRCDCGNIVNIASSQLVSGKTKSCGCISKERFSKLRALDLKGKRFGRLVAIEPTMDGKIRCWRCICDCGNETIVKTNYLTSGDTQSCGCLLQESRVKNGHKAGYKHGGSDDRLYDVWHGMKKRCQYEKAINYRDYGGRGISICNEWESYEPFKEWAMKNGYNPNAKRGECTIDRIDVNGNYEPNNCRWVSAKVQASNKRNSI